MGFRRRGGGGAELRARRRRREMIGRRTAVWRRCHWLPYLKEMRRAEEGGTGRESRRVKKERKKGIVISHGDCPQMSPRSFSSYTNTKDHTHTNECHILRSLNFGKSSS